MTTLGQTVMEVNPPPELPPKDYTIGQTVKKMAKVVVTGETDEYAADPENDVNLTPDQRGYSISDAFDRGARLAMPEPPKGDLDDTYRVAKERIQTQMRSPSRRGSSAKAAGSEELTKLFAAGMITLIAFTLGEDFLPTAQEADELARPLANILSRRIDLAAKLGKDTNDVIAFAIAIMAYTVRVGPVAMEKTRYAWRDRQERLRADRVLSGRPADSAGESSVVNGTDAGTGTSHGPSYSPIDAIAQTRERILGGLDRDLGNGQGRNPALGSVRQ